MKLTAIQADLLRHLRSAVEAKPNRRVVYCSECLGWLPYVFYHWVEVDGQDISKTFPLDWHRADLEALERVGLLAKIDEWQNPQDEYDTKITYEVPPPA
ncbi:MAG TPA: hypothetical protein VG122_22930 [Gemmata sp.]|nr:hypothetical protein [Gemmata sp.]